MKLALLFVVPFACLILTTLVCNALWPQPPQAADASNSRSEDLGNRLARQHTTSNSAPADLVAASTNPVERERARKAMFPPPTAPAMQNRLDQEEDDDGFDPSVHGGLPAGFALADLRSASE
ncbi:hypothetical protein [Burkholderia cenocepacia]|uniref:hypothetical protein n=1 Tax=Burkholderia cenocepacia TaxID=95486 RepID=UPI000A50E5C4|nr:hypothetical protein [Burkholderia cenocepacia]